MITYDHYKQVNAGWITGIPFHWEATAVKYVCTFNDEVLPETFDPEALIDYVEISDVDESRGLKSSELMPYKAAPSRARRIVRDGDVIISTVRTYLRAVAPITSPPENLVVSTGFAVIRPERLISGFARYALVAEGFVGSVIARSTGVSYPAINASDLVRIPVPVPPLDEQIAIAAYLDAETKRIDELISAKMNLKEKLSGLSQSIFIDELVAISNKLPGAVTARLPWMPTVPSSWTRCKVKHLVNHFDQGVSPQCESRKPDEGEWGVMKAGCINSGNFDPTESKALPPEITPIPEVTVCEGDLIISRANTRDLVGRSAVSQHDYPRLMLSDKLYRLKLDKARCVPEFLRRTLWVSAVRSRIEERASGASPSMQNIDRRTILELDIVLPTIDEQVQILVEVDARTQAIQLLTEHVNTEIELLAEMRSATITDAVLGRIDVRKSQTH
jgi:type I restriction enzyme S subunit